MTNALYYRIKNLPIVSANVEASYIFSAKITRIQIQARGANPLKFAHVAGSISGGTYQTIKSGGVYSEIGLNATPKYYFTGTPGDVVELLYWY